MADGIVSGSVGEEHVLYLSSPGSEELTVGDPRGVRPRFSDEGYSAREVAMISAISFGSLIAQISKIPVIQFGRDKPELGPGVVDPMRLDGQDDTARIIANATYIVVLPIYSRRLVREMRWVVRSGQLVNTTFIIPGKATVPFGGKLTGFAEMREVLASTIRLPQPGMRTQLFETNGISAVCEYLSTSSLERYSWSGSRFHDAFTTTT